MASIKFDHVWKRFGEVTVLKDLDIDINDQEFLVLVGPSGCGKTTALRCIAGLEEITDGNILIGNGGAQPHLRDGRINVDEEYRTSLAGVWAGGDCVLGHIDLTVQAVEDGKRAAASIHRFLATKDA